MHHCLVWKCHVMLILCFIITPLSLVCLIVQSVDVFVILIQAAGNMVEEINIFCIFPRSPLVTNDGTLTHLGVRAYSVVCGMQIIKYQAQLEINHESMNAPAVPVSRSAI